MPPEPHRLVADVDAALVQLILDVAERWRDPNDIITARRMISGLDLKYLNGEGLVIGAG
jgi:hypothetical protein